ncbi:hypothetical protein [Morganella morganii]|uniref:hypothetical protein n=1 Tax=Morganella morganii TaxID=582 RepID=UPI001BABF51C|nr:hypothetical protein [Morganella morganii]MBT0510069.1 hypothetical protein [Morganella morganii subsp. morganii]QUI27337.1 hypothetical protein H4431_16920 [Morganella morganii]
MTEYEIPLGSIVPSDLEGIKDLFEQNEDLFKDSVLANFVGDDPRYDYCDGSFSISDINEENICFTAKVSYYGGCKDMNFEHQYEGCVSYDIIDNKIIFELEESAWLLDN